MGPLGGVLRDCPARKPGGKALLEGRRWTAAGWSEDFCPVSRQLEPVYNVCPGLHCPRCQGWSSPPSFQPASHRNSSPQDHLPSTLTQHLQDFSKSSSHFPSLLLFSQEPQVSSSSPSPSPFSSAPSLVPCFCREKAAGLALILENWKPFTFGLTYLPPWRLKNREATTVSAPYRAFAFFHTLTLGSSLALRDREVHISQMGRLRPIGRKHGKLPQ